MQSNQSFWTKPTLLFAVFLLSTLSLTACDSGSDSSAQQARQDRPARTAPVQRANPLDSDWSSPYHVPPFHQVQPNHLPAALEQAIEKAGQTISEIAAQSAPASFENTVLALEQAEQPVLRIARLWYGLAAVSDDDELDRIEPGLNELLARHRSRLIGSTALFERIEEIRHAIPDRPFTEEQLRLVDQTWKHFRRAGAHLDDDSRKTLADLDRQLAKLDQAWASVRREARHPAELYIDQRSELEGMPDSLLTLAERTALDLGHDGGWSFTLHAHSFYPFMRYATSREHRRELYQLWKYRYEQLDRTRQDPDRLIGKMANLRAQRAALLGFDSHLDYMLDDASITRGQLDELLEELTAASRAKAAGELEKIRRLAAEDGVDDELREWDWWHYRQRLSEDELDTEPGELRQWFMPEQVLDGMLILADRLWGLTFRQRPELPSWHIDATPYEVIDRDGTTLGIVYFDTTHRLGKLGGAWTSHYRVQHYADAKRQTPVVAIVANMPPPAAGQPSGLSADQVETLFHEFGHAMHSLLSDVHHPALAGTNVPPDFVEFPAMLLEHWALAPELLSLYARGHESGDFISNRAIEILHQRRRLSAGLEMLEFIAAIKLDLELHGASEGRVPNIEIAERQVRSDLELPRMLSPRHHGNGLVDIFANRRSGADFNTLWSRLLAADAFAAFRELGAFDSQLAESLRIEIFSRGNARSPEVSWRKFRGRAPTAEFLLEESGLSLPEQGD